MNRKPRFHIRRPSIRLYDTTGLSTDVQSGLRMMILAVVFGMVFTNITTGAAWTGFQRMLGANALTLGILSAIPVAASTLQIFASYALERWRARRTLFLVFGLSSRLVWVVIALIPYFLPEGMVDLRLAALMALLALAAGGGAFVNVGFYSLVGDLVPLKIRGRYFSSRQAVSLLAGILAGLFVSWLLDVTTGFIGYTIVLAVAGVFGAADIACFFWVKWPPMAAPEAKRQGFFSMLREVLADRGYMRIVLYFTFWFFSVNIMGPFFNVYCLEVLKMSYTEITIFNQILSNVVTVLVIASWGRQMDRFGNQPVVQTAGLFCMIIPLLYIFSGLRAFAAIPISSVISGAMWPASDLGQQNMYLNRAPTRNRSMYVAVFFASTQLLGTALSNFVGGLLMNGPLILLENLNISILGFAQTRYQYLFALSATLRIVAVLALLPRLREPSDTPASQMVRELIGHGAGRLLHFRHGARVKRLRRQYRKQNPHTEGD